jgi:hypothetical protein
MNKEFAEESSQSLIIGAQKLRGVRDQFEEMSRKRGTDGRRVRNRNMDLDIQWRETMARLLTVFKKRIEYFEKDNRNLDREFPTGSEWYENFQNDKFANLHDIDKAELIIRRIVDAALEYLG